MRHVTVAIFLIFFASPAMAQMICGPTKTIQDRLIEKETPRAFGIGHNGALVEVWASADGKFTVLLTRPDGLSCFLAIGSNFEIVTDPKPAGGLTSLSPLSPRG